MTTPPPAAPAECEPPSTVSFPEALRYWFKLGCISFGGPAGQIALMHEELVERRRWISERRFLHALNYCMVLPGPEATQLAVYIGWLLHRTPGGIVAGTLFVLPSLLLLILLSWIYLAWGHLPLVAGVLYGVKPAVVAIVAAAGWRLGTRTLRNPSLILIALAAFIAIAVLHLPFPFVIAGAAVLGIAGGRLVPGHFAPAASGHGASGQPSLPALIGDDTPPPAHARPGWRTMLLPALAGIGIGMAAWGLLAATLGEGHALARMGGFFTKAALLTFGGAYAVLPYVVQNAVDNYHWLTPAQMIDGLALGETTPGPLIMIVSFVGFVGGWSQAVLGGQPFLGGVAGAVVATFFTFLPSFVFILAGGPVVEATRDDLRLTAPLTAISAAVVGVILSLALFFAWHVFRLGAAPRDWDAMAMIVAAGAALALIRYRLGTIPVIGACGIAGLVISYLR
ncbi:chromate efflux transporter [Noviherbaspirillum galbum]|uniref:Chromate efflux transporter n=1 Tax=Noviherbaspirillum galbum TaxID=2709383 RepID=A0A6B3SPI2_9BURK|nr:chromate efflux transporter [Noviherbaspirillum galbum]NEX62744.1 chromate efflux transporter [Noviherbaspirillum galbum]